MNPYEQAQAYLETVLTELRYCGNPWQPRSRIEAITFAPGFCEPGYDSDQPVAFGNWNFFHGEEVSANWRDLLPKIGEKLEELGFELEWSDEWATCPECGKAFRTSPDSYGWTRSYYDFDGEWVCHECVKPADVLADLEGNPRKALTLPFDPTDYGYKLVQRGFETGFHPEQDDDPKVIAKSLESRGVERFIFKLDDVGQFDARFSLYVHEDEFALLGEAALESRAAISPAVALQAALQSIPHLPPKEGHVVVSQCHGDGTATSKYVSHQEFIEGKA